MPRPPLQNPNACPLLVGYEGCLLNGYGDVICCEVGLAHAWQRLGSRCLSVNRTYPSGTIAIKDRSQDVMLAKYSGRK